KGLETNARRDDEPWIEASPCDQDVESGSCHLAVGGADVASILQKLRGHTDVENSRVEIDGVPRCMLDRLRKTANEEVEPVLDFDDPLLDDESLTLILADLGQKSLDAQLRAAGGRFLGLGDFKALLEKLDGLIEIQQPLLERRQLVVVFGRLRHQP